MTGPDLLWSRSSPQQLGPVFGQEATLSRPKAAGSLDTPRRCHFKEPRQDFLGRGLATEPLRGPRADVGPPASQRPGTRRSPPSALGEPLGKRRWGGFPARPLPRRPGPGSSGCPLNGFRFPSGSGPRPPEKAPRLAVTADAVAAAAFPRRCPAGHPGSGGGGGAASRRPCGAMGGAGAGPDWRDSLPYYYCVKFALSASSTLFSVGHFPGRKESGAGAPGELGSAATQPGRPLSRRSFLAGPQPPRPERSLARSPAPSGRGGRRLRVVGPGAAIGRRPLPAPFPGWPNRRAPPLAPGLARRLCRWSEAGGARLA